MYKRRVTGEGSTFRESNRMRFSCTECYVTVAVSYLKAHMAQIHGICVPQMRGVDEVGVRANHLCVVLPQVVADRKVSGARVSGGSP